MGNIYADPGYIEYIPFRSVNYLLRNSDANSDTSRQRKLIESFIEGHGFLLPPMNARNTIEETVSGTVSPYDRFLRKLPIASVLCVSNLDRILKSVSLNCISALHRSLMVLGISVLLANEKEFFGLMTIRTRIFTQKKVLDRYVEFVRDRMSESLNATKSSKVKERNSKSENKGRKDLRRYCRRYLGLIKDAFRKVKYQGSSDFGLWIIACFTGHLVNEYLRDTR